MYAPPGLDHVERVHLLTAASPSVSHWSGAVGGGAWTVTGAGAGFGFGLAVVAGTAVVVVGRTNLYAVGGGAG